MKDLQTVSQYHKTFKGKREQGIVTLPYIYQLIKRGKLKVVKIAGKMFIEKGTKPE